LGSGCAGGEPCRLMRSAICSSSSSSRSPIGRTLAGRPDRRSGAPNPNPRAGFGCRLPGGQRSEAWSWGSGFGDSGLGHRDRRSGGGGRCICRAGRRRGGGATGRWVGVSVSETEVLPWGLLCAARVGADDLWGPDSAWPSCHGLGLG
jgi:hypothetical protein